MQYGAHKANVVHPWGSRQSKMISFSSFDSISLILVIEFWLDLFPILMKSPSVVRVLGFSFL